MGSQMEDEALFEVSATPTRVLFIKTSSLNASLDDMVAKTEIQIKKATSTLKLSNAIEPRIEISPMEDGVIVTFDHLDEATNVMSSMEGVNCSYIKLDEFS